MSCRRPGLSLSGPVSSASGWSAPPEVLDAALASLADRYGDAWQPGTRKPSRHDGGDVLQYGTLIVPVPRD